LSFIARYSGARPPGITNPSYPSALISSNEAFSAKLWPLVSAYVYMKNENDRMSVGLSEQQCGRARCRLELEPQFHSPFAQITSHLIWLGCPRNNKEVTYHETDRRTNSMIHCYSWYR
jgi:hypothetical protein